MLHCPAPSPSAPRSTDVQLASSFIQQKLQAVKYCHAQRSWGRSAKESDPGWGKGGVAIGFGTWQRCMTAGRGRREARRGEITRSFVASINTILMSAAWRFCWRSLGAPQFGFSTFPFALPAALSCSCRHSPAALAA